MILAGGLGTRLRTVVSDRPKPLASIGRTPFIEILVQSLADKGVRDFVLLTGYRGEMIEDFFNNAKWARVSIRFSREYVALGTGGAVKQAEAFATEPTLLVNGDTFFDADLEKLVEFHINKRVGVTLSLVRVQDVSRYGAVQLDEHGMVTGFREKGQDSSGPGWINAGLSLLSLDVIRGLPAGQSFSMEREVFPELARARRMAGLGQDRPFYDIGTPESYTAFATFVQNRKGGRHGSEKNSDAGR
jgi:D-glycero-alpha-D-manno-heptose 1-phosphate guanylyltransferase